MDERDEPVIALQGVADAVPGLVAIIDRQGRYRYNNRAFEQWFGLSRDQIRGRHVSAVLGPAAFDVLKAHLESALHGRAATFEATVPCQDRTRTVQGSYLPQHGPTGEVERVVAVVFDVTTHRRLEEARAGAEACERRYRFLAEAGEVLASSVQYEATLQAAVRLAIPALADWAGVDILDERGAPRRLAIAATDPEAEKLGWELAERYPTGADEPEGLAKVVRTGQPELYPEISEELIVASAHDDEHARIVRGLGFRSALIVPLNARGRTFGALWFATTRSGRVYGFADLELATRLAELAALAVDNARLYAALGSVSGAAGGGGRRVGDRDEKGRLRSEEAP